MNSEQKNSRDGDAPMRLRAIVRRRKLSPDPEMQGSKKRKAVPASCAGTARMREGNYFLLRSYTGVAPFMMNVQVLLPCSPQTSRCIFTVSS